MRRDSSEGLLALPAAAQGPRHSPDSSPRPEGAKSPQQARSRRGALTPSPAPSLLGRSPGAAGTSGERARSEQRGNGNGAAGPSPRPGLGRRGQDPCSAPTSLGAASAFVPALRLRGEARPLAEPAGSRGEPHGGLSTPRSCRQEGEGEAGGSALCLGPFPCPPAPLTPGTAAGTARRWARWLQGASPGPRAAPAALWGHSGATRD